MTYGNSLSQILGCGSQRFAGVAESESSFGARSLITVTQSIRASWSLSCRSFRFPQVPDVQAHAKDQPDGDQEAHDHYLVMRERNNEGQMFAEIGGEEHPNAHPKYCAYGVEQGEAPPGHSEHSGHDAVELTQDAEEACEQHRRRAVAGVFLFDPAETFIGQTDLRAVAQDGRSSEFSADQKTEIVADNRTHPRRDEQSRQRQLSAPGQNRRKYQQRFAGDRRADRLDRQDWHDRECAVVANEAFQAGNELADIFHRFASSLPKRHGRTVTRRFVKRNYP